MDVGWAQQYRVAEAAAALTIWWTVARVLRVFAAECSLERREALSVCPINPAEYLAERLDGRLSSAVLPPALLVVLAGVSMWIFTAQAIWQGAALTGNMKAVVGYLTLTVTTIPMVLGAAFPLVAMRMRGSASDPTRGLMAPMILIGIAAGLVTVFAEESARSVLRNTWFAARYFSVRHMCGNEIIPPIIAEAMLVLALSPAYGMVKLGGLLRKEGGAELARAFPKVG